MRFNQIVHFSYIGLASIFNKFILIIIAWFLSTEAYPQFNRIYYAASTLALIGTLGFHYALKRTSTRSIFVYISVLVNISIVFLVLNCTGFSFIQGEEMSNTFLLSFLLSISGIYAFNILYSGNYKRYFYLSLFLFLLQLISLLISALTGIKFIYLFTIDILISFFAGYRFYIKGTKGWESIKPLYRNGISIFIINSSAGMALIADKFFVNHYFIPGIANAYTFAWSLTAPIFYFGNIVEKYIYSVEGTPLIKSLILRTSLIQLCISGGYTLLILTMVNLFPYLLPHSVSVDWLKKIIPVMLIGYSCYTIFHFPLNGVLLKFTKARVQENTAFLFVGAIIVYFTVIFLSLRNNVFISFYYLLTFIWFYLFTLTLIRYNILRRSLEYI